MTHGETGPVLLPGVPAHAHAWRVDDGEVRVFARMWMSPCVRVAEDQCVRAERAHGGGGLLALLAGPQKRIVPREEADGTAADRALARSEDLALEHGRRAEIVLVPEPRALAADHVPDFGDLGELLPPEI